jgi:hypothetical protein
MSFVVPPNTYNPEELPVWPVARRQVPAAITGKTTWSHSITSPVLQATSGVGAGQVLTPTPNGDAPDASVTGNVAIPAGVDRQDCANAAGAAAVTKLQTELTTVQGYLTTIGGKLPAPTMTVTSVAASSGPLAGGTNVTITGTGFVLTGTTTVTFSGRAATAVVVTNATTITCTTPAGLQAGPAGVLVSNSGGAAAYKAGAFTYTPAPAAASGISPKVGLAAGGTAVTIVGTGFTGATGVTFGGTAATGVVVAGDGYITCTTPAHATGAVNVVVQSPNGNSTLTNGFTYQ